MKNIIYSIFILLTILLSSNVSAEIINVNPGNNLDSIIESSKGGDTIMVASGKYDPLFLTNLTFKESAPLVVKSVVDGGATIYREELNSDAAIMLRYCSYIKFEGFVLEGGCWAVYVWGGDHIILNNNEMKNTGQEGIHIGYSAKYVDVIGNHVHNTGLNIPKYGEGIYVGNGSRSRFPDNCENVWIENNVVHDCANGEGINIKPECFHITVNENEIYNIAPGTSEQTNQAAISVEGAQISIDSSYRLDESRDIWITSNTVYNVTAGYNNWGNGIMAAPIGVSVVGNTIHDCEYKGFYGNHWKAFDSIPIYYYDNTITDCGQKQYWNADLCYVIEEDPGENPNIKQSWKTVIVEAGSILLRDTTKDLEVDEIFQLTAIIEPEDATYWRLLWSSNDTSVVTVDSTGVLTAKNTGNATITVVNSKEEVYATCAVNVYIAALSITLSDTIKTLEEGNTFQLSAEIFPDTATYQDLRWISSDTSIITVDETGLVTAIKTGNAAIIVSNTANEVSDTCLIEVIEITSGAISVSLEDNLQVYPNPLHDMLNIVGVTGRIVIYNIQGQKMLEQEIKNKNCVIELSSLSKGNYLMNIITEDLKVIVKKIYKY